MSSHKPAEPQLGKKEQEELDQGGMAFDFYVIKGRTAPREGGEEPRSLQDVRARIKRHLMRLAVDVFGLSADILSTARAIVRGIGSGAKGLYSLPAAIAKRIAGGHEMADSAEDGAQELLESGGSAPLPPERASLGLQLLLEHHRASGKAVRVIEDEKGNMIIMVVRPDREELAQEGSKAAIEAATDPKLLEDPSDKPSEEPHQ